MPPHIRDPNVWNSSKFGVWGLARFKRFGARDLTLSERGLGYGVIFSDLGVAILLNGS